MLGSMQHIGNWSLVLNKSLWSLANQRAPNISKLATGPLSNEDTGPLEWIQTMEFIKHVFTFYTFISFHWNLFYFILIFYQVNLNYTYLISFVLYVFMFLMAVKILL